MSAPYGPAQGLLPEEELASFSRDCWPKSLGAVPRLGLGSRTTVLGWPVIFRFLSSNVIFANAIQNSVARELMPFYMLHSDKRPDAYLPGLGAVQVGHTGSTIEGLVPWGAFSAAKADYNGPGFGADADHLPIYKPGSDQWQQTLKLIECSRDFTHFTLDIGSIVDWTKGPISRLTEAPDVIATTVNEINKARSGEPFDLEISLDESPESISPDAAATSPDEMTWLLDTLNSSGINIHYAAPHLGFTKGSDIVDHELLADTVDKLHQIAMDHNALLSIHSGDYLSSATRIVLGQACQGNLLYKVSPAIQDILFDAIQRNDPSLATQLTEWTVNHAKKCGYSFDSPEDAFHKCAFAAFGIQNNTGDFEMRKTLYGVMDNVKQAFESDLMDYLHMLSDDLMISKKG